METEKEEAHKPSLPDFNLGKESKEYSFFNPKIVNKYHKFKKNTFKKNAQPGDSGAHL